MKDLIKPLRSFRRQYGKSLYCHESEVRTLEANYQEAVEALIDVIQKVDNYVTMPEHKRMFKSHFNKQFRIIEKATGQKWENLKD